MQRLELVRDIPTSPGVPYTYWCIGGIDPDPYQQADEAGRISEDIPVDHSPAFAPVIQPTLDTGTQALVVAAWPGSPVNRHRRRPRRYRCHLLRVVAARPARSADRPSGSRNTPPLRPTPPAHRVLAPHPPTVPSTTAAAPTEAGMAYSPPLSTPGSRRINTTPAPATEITPVHERRGRYGAQQDVG